MTKKNSYVLDFLLGSSAKEGLRSHRVLAPAALHQNSVSKESLCWRPRHPVCLTGRTLSTKKN